MMISNQHVNVLSYHTRTSENCKQYQCHYNFELYPHLRPLKFCPGALIYYEINNDIAMTTAKTINNEKISILSFVFKYLHSYVFITAYPQFPLKRPCYMYI